MERNLGPQPIAELMTRPELLPKHLVEASTDQITHKMVSRATKGRRLTPNTMEKVRRALNAAARSEYGLQDLFNYDAKERRDGEA